MHAHDPQHQQAVPARSRAARPGTATATAAPESVNPERVGPDAAVSGGPSVEDVLALQCSVGNAAAARFVAQARQAEQEAEPAVQRSSVPEVLRSSGRALDPPMRADMEARLGADFSSVRVHTGAAAARSAEEVGARAYTSGDHVVIGRGGTDRHTLAHELTHVIQQRQGPVAGVDNGSGLAVSDPGDRFERAAEANARRVMSGSTPDLQHQPPEHTGSATRTAPTVQRMPIAAFQQQLAQRGVAGDPDFITFFEIHRGRLDPGAVVADSNPGSQARLQQLVGTPEVTAQLVDQYINDYQAGAAGNQTQPTALANPNVTGLEIEMPRVVLRIPKDTAVHNGDLLGSTAAQTAVGLPVMKLEVEGMDRGTPTVELIYGPLPSAAYQSQPLLTARNRLTAALTKRGRLSELLAAYNNSLPQNSRYRLTPTALAGSLTKNPTAEGNPNTQTNISTPYTKLGQAPGGNRDFIGFFENADDKTMYRKAREEAGRLAGEIDGNWSTNHQNAGQLSVGPNVTSLLTHILFQEAKYAKHRVDRQVERPEDKHHFHVMMKLSPQDVVMSILSDDEAKLVLAWLVDRGAGSLATAAVDTFRTLSSHQQVAADPATLYRYMVDVLVARLLAGRQLLEQPAAGSRASRVYGGNRAVGQVSHFHPRPSNRVPITVHNNRYYMVVEQRSAAHPLNDRAVNDNTKAGLISDLQTP
jgi:hypothetical protein